MAWVKVRERPGKTAMCSFGCGLGTPSIGSSAHSRPCPADGVDAIEKAKWAAPVPPPARLTSGKEIAPVQGLSTTHRIPESFKRDSDHSAWFGPGEVTWGYIKGSPKTLVVAQLFSRLSPREATHDESPQIHTFWTLDPLYARDGSCPDAQ